MEKEAASTILWFTCTIRERKRNNIIFGVQEMEDDGALIESHFHDRDIRFTSDDIRAKYRVGQPSSEKRHKMRPRPALRHFQRFSRKRYGPTD